MRAETHELQLGVIWLAVNQHQIKPDMAIPVVFPATGQRMVKLPLGQRLVMRQGRDDDREIAEQRLRARAGTVQAHAE